MAFNISYDWSVNTQDSDWTFDGPAGGGLQTAVNQYRFWTYQATGGSPSTNIGPTSGQGGTDGFVYPESSTGLFPTATEFWTMALDTPFDASTDNVVVSFYTNQRGDDNDAVCELQTNENGAGWVTRATFGGPGDVNKVATGGIDVWVLRDVDLTGIVTNASTVIRFRIATPPNEATNTHWHCDYGLDTISIVGTDLITQTHQLII
jgi:hypothetical protein